jgi:hypothetical protein
LQVIYLSGTNRPGLLTAISAALRDLNLDVNKAVVETDAQNGKISDKFFVQMRGGGKLEDKEQLDTVEKALTTLLDRAAGNQLQPRPKFTTVSIQQDENKRELLYTLMGEQRVTIRRGNCAATPNSSGRPFAAVPATQWHRHDRQQRPMALMHSSSNGRVREFAIPPITTARPMWCLAHAAQLMLVAETYPHPVFPYP